MTVIALIPVVGFDVTFDRLTIPGIGDFDIGWVAYPLTVLWIALLANLVNLIDGMDSLAAGIVAIAAAAFAILAASFGRADAAVLSAIVCGSTLAFLYHNYHPAKIFMGDSGALALGFLLATLSRSTACSRRPRRSRSSRRCWCSPCRSSTRRSWCSSGSSTAGRRGARTTTTSTTGSCASASRSGRTAAYLHLWALMMAGYALLARFVPPRPRGDWDLQRSLLLTGAGLLVIGGSIWMVYSLEILKSRHLHAVGLRRFGHDAPPTRSRASPRRPSSARSRPRPPSYGSGGICGSVCGTTGAAPRRAVVALAALGASASRRRSRASPP